MPWSTEGGGHEEMGEGPEVDPPEGTYSANALLVDCDWCWPLSQHPHRTHTLSMT